VLRLLAYPAEFLAAYVCIFCVPCSSGHAIFGPVRTLFFFSFQNNQKTTNFRYML